MADQRMSCLDERLLEPGRAHQHQCQYQCEHAEHLPAHVDGGGVARDGWRAAVYAVSDVTTADNGDVIAAVADDAAPYSFIKYVDVPPTSIHHRPPTSSVHVLVRWPAG